MRLQLDMMLMGSYADVGGRGLKVRRFYATPKAKRHMLRKHGVEWHEVVEVLRKQPTLYRLLLPRYFAVSQTDAGRLLYIVLEHEGASVLRVVTAREPKGQKQRRRYRRRRRK